MIDLTYDNLKKYVDFSTLPLNSVVTFDMRDYGGDVVYINKSHKHIVVSSDYMDNEFTIDSNTLFIKPLNLPACDGMRNNNTISYNKYIPESNRWVYIINDISVIVSSFTALIESLGHSSLIMSYNGNDQCGHVLINGKQTKKYINSNRQFDDLCEVEIYIKSLINDVINEYENIRSDEL